MAKYVGPDSCPLITRVILLSSEALLNVCIYNQTIVPTLNIIPAIPIIFPSLALCISVYMML